MALSTYRADSAGCVGLEWEGRWGRWADHGIHVLAACVAELEVVGEGALDHVDEALREISQTMQEELPEGDHCVNFKCVGPTSSNRLQIRAAFACETETCQRLRRTWQRRPLSVSTSITVSWTSVSDTSQTAHTTAIAGRLAKYTQAETGLALELPARWVAQVLPEGQDKTSLAPGGHWFDFSSLFGQVIAAELMQVVDSNVVMLLVRFGQSAGARAMFEALTDRYLYNPLNKSTNDTHPVTCAIGIHQELFARLRSRASTETSFMLRRVGTAEKKGVGPATIHITSARHRVVIGREESCDVMLRRAHVSKAHATVALHPKVPRTYMLTIQDTSANGTWVNGVRLRSNVVTELQFGDRISFLPEQHDFYQDSLLYEVASGVGVPEVDPKQSVAQKRKSGAAPDAREARLRRRHQGSTSSQSATTPAANVHVAQPVAVDVLDSGALADDGVVDVDDVASDHSDGSDVAPTVPWTMSDDVGTWVRGLDGGSVAEYERTLLSLFDSVAQIKELYANRLQDFFTDVQVQDPMHRLAFSTALRTLRT